MGRPNLIFARLGSEAENEIPDLSIDHTFFDETIEKRACDAETAERVTLTYEALSVLGEELERVCVHSQHPSMILRVL